MAEIKKIYVRNLTRKNSARTETDSPNVRNMISLNRKKSTLFYIEHFKKIPLLQFYQC
ncbi:hypothetical protein MUS_0327 [Bacillus velezensis YAU B9601-Y2]|uniref:Uncharacterized protein n=1 Tax=Bacillus amyloliquefaciens (strain Y2) TaxID=1155777 RepID=I2C185_BACAY|nr:hypothetical protein MUS_0327 [Bacillus velezensis YAU B9601-Y2]